MSIIEKALEKLDPPAAPDKRPAPKLEDVTSRAPVSDNVGQQARGPLEKPGNVFAGALDVSTRADGPESGRAVDASVDPDEPVDSHEHGSRSAGMTSGHERDLATSARSPDEARGVDLPEIGLDALTTMTPGSAVHSDVGEHALRTSAASGSQAEPGTSAGHREPSTAYSVSGSSVSGPAVSRPTVDSPSPRHVSAEVQIDVARLTSMGLLTPQSDNTQLAEQMRIIKRPLLMQATDTGKEHKANANLILVASALPNEGKTSTAINLAISIAMERDRTILLVDADVAKSDISRTLGIEQEKGLTDLLHDAHLTVPDVMLRTNIPTLSVIPSGQRHPNVTELFAGDDMRRLMLDLSQRYPERIIVIDSPPLLATSGASVLGSLVGQIVMVVEAVRTPQSAVIEALRMLGPLDNIGIVLNKAREKPKFSYGYGYDYYYRPGN